MNVMHVFLISASQLY